MTHLAALVIRDRLANLLGTVHDERSVSHDGFINRRAAQQERRRVVRTVDADARPARSNSPTSAAAIGSEPFTRSAP